MSLEEFNLKRNGHIGPMIEIGSHLRRSFAIEKPIQLHHSRDQDQYTEDLLMKSDSLKPVASAFFDPQGKLVAHAWSTSMSNRTEHAESNLIYHIQDRNLSARCLGGTLISTLRPCAMCAANITSYFSKSSAVKIRFLQEDPRPLSKNSTLIPGSDLWARAGRPDFEIIGPTRSHP
jgi:tRNA(Arg) A34 adenosine deaminase TadA